jgi:hypothetical protein
VIDSSIVRRAAPLLLLVVVASTGTLLASDPCKTFVVQKLTGAARSAQQHTAPAHKHTKATLAAWEGWGKSYLAKHGHPYVPPKRPASTSNPGWQKQQEDALKFACELPQVPTVDMPFATLLVPNEAPPFVPDIPTLTAELTYPPETDLPPGTSDTPGTPGTPGDDAGPPPPTYINEPIFFPPPRGPNSAPPVDTPPVDTPPAVPEPGSFVLLATGIAAIVGVRRKRETA